MPAGKIVKSGFKPAWWLPGAHSQTLWPYLFRKSPTLKYTRERLELPDGDFVDLCWTGNASGPIIGVFHGLEGSIDSPYAAAMMASIHQHGWRGVFMHFRGCSGTPNRLARSYHSGDTADIGFLIETLHTRFPDTALAAIGYSLGGNALLKYLGETGTSTPLKAAVAVSVPYQLHDSASKLSHGISRLYQWRLLRCLRLKLKLKFQDKIAPVDLSDLDSLNTFHKFDDKITAPLHGFRDVDDYYGQSSCRQYLADIQKPVLLLHANNDPFMTTAAIPEAHELSDNVMLELAESGGHVGFTGGALPWKPAYWLEPRIINYLEQMI